MVGNTKQHRYGKARLLKLIEGPLIGFINEVTGDEEQTRVRCSVFSVRFNPDRVAPIVALPAEAVKMQAAINFLPTKCRVRPVSKEAQLSHTRKGGTEWEKPAMLMLCAKPLGLAKMWRDRW